MERLARALLASIVLLAGCENGRGPVGGRGGGGGTVGRDAEAGDSTWLDAQPPADARSDMDGGLSDFGFTHRDAEIPDSGLPPPARSIGAIQDPAHPSRVAVCFKDGSSTTGVCPPVELSGMVVTAAGAYVSSNLRALWIQDPADADGRYAGIKIVYPASSASYIPEIGHVVDVRAQASSFRGSYQLDFATFTRNGSNLVNLPAVEVAPSAVGRINPSSHAYEGVLVTIRNVSVVEACIADAQDRDHGQWSVSGGVLIGTGFEYSYNGQLRPSTTPCFDGNNIPTGLCGCSAPGGSSRPFDQRRVGDTFAAITGVLDYAFDEFQLLPRGDTDLSGPF